MFSEHPPLRVPPEQKLLLTKACEDLEQEKQEREEEKVRYLGEKIPPLQVSGMSMEELQNLCKQLHSKIEVVDEERYDCESKVKKHNNDVGGPSRAAEVPDVTTRVSLWVSFDFLTSDPRTEAENPGFRRQVQEAGPEEGEGVRG